MYAASNLPTRAFASPVTWPATLTPCQASPPTSRCSAFKTPIPTWLAQKAADRFSRGLRLKARACSSGRYLLVLMGWFALCSLPRRDPFSSLGPRVQGFPVQEKGTEKESVGASTCTRDGTRLLLLLRFGSQPVECPRKAGCPLAQV